MPSIRSIDFLNFQTKITMIDKKPYYDGALVNPVILGFFPGITQELQRMDEKYKEFREQGESAYTGDLSVSASFQDAVFDLGGHKLQSIFFGEGR